MLSVLGYWAVVPVSVLMDSILFLKALSSLLQMANKEYNEIMFLREITHTVNMFNDMGDIVRLYSKNPETATVRLANLLSMISGGGKNPNRYCGTIRVMIYLHAESISSVPIAPMQPRLHLRKESGLWQKVL